MRMPAMQAVVKVLESEGVDYAFGIPGAAILPLYDAMRKSSIKHLTVRHEEARRTRRMDIRGRPAKLALRSGRPVPRAPT